MMAAALQAMPIHPALKGILVYAACVNGRPKLAPQMTVTSAPGEGTQIEVEKIVP